MLQPHLSNLTRDFLQFKSSNSDSLCSIFQDVLWNQALESSSSYNIPVWKEAQQLLSIMEPLLCFPINELQLHNHVTNFSQVMDKIIVTFALLSYLNLFYSGIILGSIVYLILSLYLFQLINTVPVYNKCHIEALLKDKQVKITCRNT